MYYLTDLFYQDPKIEKDQVRIKGALRTFVRFFVLSRNRAPPAKSPEEYVAFLYESLQWIDLATRADFLFFYVMFDFHGLLAQRPANIKVYPLWLKSYRDSIAQALGISFDSREWEDLMKFQKNLSEKIEKVEKDICLVNVTNTIVNGNKELHDPVHTEYAKLWCAMRYHPIHWESDDNLRALLAEIEHKECRYDVPLFSQYAEFYKKKTFKAVNVKRYENNCYGVVLTAFCSKCSHPRNGHS